MAKKKREIEYYEIGSKVWAMINNKAMQTTVEAMQLPEKNIKNYMSGYGLEYKLNGSLTNWTPAADVFDTKEELLASL